MSKLVLNRDPGKVDEYGLQLQLQRLFSGEVADGLMVTQDSGSNMSLRVKAGSGRIPTGSYPSHYWYQFAVDTADPGELVTGAASNASNPRLAYLIAWIDKTGVAGSSSITNQAGNMLKFSVINGTPGSSPNEPTTGQIEAVTTTNPYIVLALIQIGTNVSQLTNADIVDRRKPMVLRGAVQQPLHKEVTSNINSGGTGTFAPISLFNESNLVITDAGYYEVELKLNPVYAASADTQYHVRVRLNGSETILQDSTGPIALHVKPVDFSMRRRRYFNAGTYSIAVEWYGEVAGPSNFLHMGASATAPATLDIRRCQ